jgi:hypothetical protein
MRFDLNIDVYHVSLVRHTHQPHTVECVFLEALIARKFSNCLVICQAFMCLQIADCGSAEFRGLRRKKRNNKRERGENVYGGGRVEIVIG